MKFTKFQSFLFFLDWKIYNCNLCSNNKNNQILIIIYNYPYDLVLILIDSANKASNLFVCLCR